MRSVVRAAGPSTDGKHAEVFYQLDSMAALDDLLRDDPYVVGGVWTSWTARPLAHFVEPRGLIDACFDGSRRITVVEGKVRDEPRALTVLHRLRDAESLAVGGIFEDKALIAWVRTPEPGEALARLAEAGLESPTYRTLVWVL